MSETINIVITDDIIQTIQKDNATIQSYINDKFSGTSGTSGIDGTSFGKYGEGYLRISYATSIELLEQGLRKMKKSLEKLA